jgi:hypothetical protein
MGMVWLALTSIAGVASANDIRSTVELAKDPTAPPGKGVFTP